MDQTGHPYIKLGKDSNQKVSWSNQPYVRVKHSANISNKCSASVTVMHDTSTSVSGRRVTEGSR